MIVNLRLKTLAQSFADEMRQKIWASNFDHPDPVHNSPKTDELSIIPFWQNLRKNSDLI